MKSYLKGNSIEFMNKKRKYPNQSRFLIKKANTSVEEDIQEYLKCKNDPIYFAKNYVKIVSLDEGLVPFNMYDFQENLIRNFHEQRFNICKMPRQTGKSTTCVAFLLHYAVFNDSVNIGILANKAATARELLGRLQTAYENLPKWMQQGILSWNKGSMELENGSKILAKLLHLHLLSEACRLISSSSTSSPLSLITSRKHSLALFILLLLQVNRQK